MSAQSIDIFVAAFSDPLRPRRIDASQSFEYPTNQVQTLSTNAVNAGSQLDGLLYVPSLPDNHPCINASAPYVPSNVTRLENLPSTTNQYVAIAPWISQQCTLAYLAATPGSIARAFIFYQPTQNSTDTPPNPNDPSWSLDDGGQWKKANKFPVYAIPGPNGRIIMNQLGQYSGPISSVRNGAELSRYLNPNDYIRLYASFNLNLNGNLPTLWAFLLIVVAVVLVLVGTTSWLMHCVQRRNRRRLLRRIQHGEVDLELLGLRPQQMTQADVEKLPLRPFVPKKDAPDMPIPDPANTTITATTNASSPPPIPQAHDYNQPTCAICLDDFCPSDPENPVRVLPCNHIYHPQCIDHYLLSTSTLCPLCKANAKPPNPAELPQITNLMVRRERQARRLQENRGRVPRSGVYSRGEGFSGGTRTFRLRGWRETPFVRPLPVWHRVTPPVPPTLNNLAGGGGTEMQQRQSQQAATVAPVSPSRQSAVMRELETVVSNPDHPATTAAGNQAPESGRSPAGGVSAMGTEAIIPAPLGAEERRERAEGLLRAHGGTTTEAERAEIEAVIHRDRPAWRKGLGKVFPGFR